MFLNKSIPLLFGTPSTVGSYRGLLASFVVLNFGTICYLASELWRSFPYFELITLLVGIHGLTALLTSSANLLFVFRYFLVWILIFGTALVWAIYGGEVKVAPFGVEYQTYENTRILVFAGLLSLCGSLAGWHVANLVFRRVGLPCFVLSEKYRKRFLFVGAGLAAGFGLLYLYKAGGTIGGGIAYGENVRDIGFEFGVFNIFHFIGISLLLLAAISRDQIRPVILWACMITLVFGLAAGSRADFLPQLFIIFVLLFNSHIRVMLEQRRYIKILKWMVLGCLLLVLGYAGAFFIAAWRSGVNIVAIVPQMIDEDRGILINTLYGHDMFYLETGNMMLGGLYAAIVNVKEGVTGFLLGESYLNYLLTAPPAFLGLPRPLGLEWTTEISGMTMSQGGIFEVAEAYWNFGFIGCLFVSFLISLAFGWLLQKGLWKNNYFLLTWYLVFGFMAFRAIWYQNFSYFRIMTVMLIIYFFAGVFFRWFVVDRTWMKMRAHFGKGVGI